MNRNVRSEELLRLCLSGCGVLGLYFNVICSSLFFFCLSNFATGTILGKGFPQAQVHTNNSKSAKKKSNIYLEVIGARHVHSVNFNDLITGTQSSILSNEAIREDFLDYNTSLQITEIHFHLLA